MLHQFLIQSTVPVQKKWWQSNKNNDHGQWEGEIFSFSNDASLLLAVKSD